MKINFTTVNTGGFKPVEGGPSRPVDPSDAQLVEDNTDYSPQQMVDSTDYLSPQLSENLWADGGPDAAGFNDLKDKINGAMPDDDEPGIFEGGGGNLHFGGISVIPGATSDKGGIKKYS